MVRNEFQNSLFRTTADMLDAIAEEWLSAGGANSEEMQRAFLDESTDAELAIEAIDGWGLDRHGDFGEPSHMEFNEYTTSDLAAAFARLRARLQAAR
jgi:hypothetical protein